jgi:trans-aconitate 2-methyltransferase
MERRDVSPRLEPTVRWAWSCSRGCGTGRLTEQLLARLPLGCVIGIDQSSNMVSVAHDYLKPQGRRIQLLVADAAALPIREEADAVFSTATFHWVLDHSHRSSRT